LRLRKTAVTALQIQRKSKAKGMASEHSTPRPILAMAAIIRPLRPSILSARATSRGLGVAVGEFLRTANAIFNNGAAWSQRPTKARSTFARHMGNAGLFARRICSGMLDMAAKFEDGRAASSTGYGENGFLDLCQSEVPDHIQVEMRQVRKLV
jgi:hypothetical protein